MVQDMRNKRPNLQNQKWKLERRGLSRLLGLLVVLSAGVTLGLISSLMQTTASTAQTTRSSDTPTGIFASGADGVLINRQPAVPGMSIKPGDTITTDASGRARLTFMDNSTLYLAGNTQVQFLKIVDATQTRAQVLVLSIDQGVGRMLAGDQAQPEITMIRGGGGAAVIEGGTLDMVSSNKRLVTVMRSGKSSCRAANSAQLAMTEKQRACILSGGTVRPSMLSAAMKRVVDERLSIPPSTASLGDPETTAPLTDYAVNALSVEGRQDRTLPPVTEPRPGEGETQSLLLQQLASDPQ